MGYIARKTQKKLCNIEQPLAKLPNTNQLQIFAFEFELLYLCTLELIVNHLSVTIK